MPAKKEVFIIDSGYGEEVQYHEKDPIDGELLWISKLLVTNPDALRKAYLTNLNVGVNFLRTMTYQSSIEGYRKQFGYTKEQSFNVMRDHVHKVIGAWEEFSKTNPNAKRPIINGSIGSYGAYLHDGSDYTGEYKDKVTKEQLREFHKRRFDALIEGGCDNMVFETIPCRKEAEVLIEMLKEHPEKKGWVSFSCRDDGHSISSGENFQETAKYCYDMSPNQLLGIGVNCLQPRLVESLFTGINDDRNENRIPLIVYANSGEVYTKEHGYVGKDKCKPIETYVQTWLNLGVKYIGCCCQTSTEDLRKIVAEVEKWKRL